MRQVVVFLFFLLFITCCYSENCLFNDTFDNPGEWKSINGKWIVKDGLLIQENKRDTMTHISRIVEQDGVMEYEFECVYIRGLEDNYGGFGIHICINRPTRGRSWGMNKSTLLWITYDPGAYERKDCFFIQVYESTSPVKMDFLHDEEGDKYPLDPDILSPEDFIATRDTGKRIRFRVLIDCKTGQGRFYDPGRPDYYYPFDLKTEIKPGSYISLRTNSLSMGFDYVTVRRIE